jgi:hypothetical protein
MFDSDQFSSQRPYRQRDTYVLPRPSRMRSPHHRFHPLAWFVTIVVLAAIALAVYLIGNYEYGTEHSVIFTVKSLDDQASGNSHKYLVFTYQAGTRTPGTVYEDSDSILHGKTNSSNLYEALSPGQTYRCTVYGFRNTWFSSYQDLLVCSGYNLATGKETPLGQDG